MEVNTRTRLFGLNHFLLDLFEEDILISNILRDSGFDEDQIKMIRTKHINEFLFNVTNNIYKFISDNCSLSFAETIEFWYYLDGQTPKQNQNIEEDFKVFQQYLFELHKRAMFRLRNPRQLKRIKDIFVNSAKHILMNDRSSLLGQVKKDYRKRLIKESNTRIKKRKREQQKEAIENNSVFARDINQDIHTRKIFNPWLGLKRYRSNWW